MIVQTIQMDLQQIFDQVQHETHSFHQAVDDGLAEFDAVIAEGRAHLEVAGNHRYVVRSSGKGLPRLRKGLPRLPGNACPDFRETLAQTSGGKTVRKKKALTNI